MFYADGTETVSDFNQFFSKSDVIKSFNKNLFLLMEFLHFLSFKVSIQRKLCQLLHKVGFVGNFYPKIQNDILPYLLVIVLSKHF